MARRPRQPRTRPTVGSRLRWRIGAALLIVSLVPTTVLGVGTWVAQSRLLLDQSLELQRAAIRARAAAIDLYLAERLRALEVAARAHDFEDLRQPAQLRTLFDSFDLAFSGSFVDLGVIDAEGNHVAYVGPYRLERKNYARSAWFQEVMARGSYLSDVFLGYRQAPHCIVAVKRHQNGRTWILRATINNDPFYALVRATAPGTGDQAYVVNRGGLFQTPPAIGSVLSSSSLPLPSQQQPLIQTRVSEGGNDIVRTMAWLHDRQWLLVVEQPEAAIMGPINQAALTAGGLLLLVLAMLATATTLATRYLTARVDRANQQRDLLRADLIRSARLASLGEIAGGLAHEINNPLAVISAEQTNLRDLLDEQPEKLASREQMEASLARCLRQVDRCASITGKMLQFARESETQLRATPLEPALEEIVALLRGQARVRSIALEIELEPNLPEVLVDRNELEQVVVNLVNNAFYAIDQDGTVTLRAHRVGDGIEVSVTDTGSGIAPENLERVLQPFFTTKPPGKGTGLGLSVCHGLVTGWGGRIVVESQLGKGTTMRVQLRSASKPPPSHEPEAAAASAR